MKRSILTLAIALAFSFTAAPAADPIFVSPSFVWR